MKSLPVNSPEAVARLVAVAVLADGRLHDEEIVWLNRQIILDAIGMDRDAFAHLLIEFCRELVKEAEQERVFLLDDTRLSRLAAEVTDPALRRVVLSATLILAKADGKIATGEQRLLQFLLKTWDMSVDDLS